MNHDDYITDYDFDAFDAGMLPEADYLDFIYDDDED
jgi:hypothetical protein